MHDRMGKGTFTPAVLAALILFIAAFAVGTFPIRQGFLAPSGSSGIAESAGQNGISAPAGTYFDYVVMIIMENHAICDIMTSCNGSAPYMTGLANTYGLATHYVDCNAPSLPNYLCLSGGTDFGCGGYDGLPHSNTCTNLAWKSMNIVDLLVNASLTWKAYMETMPSNCYGSDSGLYIAHHDPFVYYANIVNNASRCNRVIPAGTSGSALLNDLGSTSTASNYMWFTPNNCNNMHSCSIATGDNYLKALVPKILNSTVFATTRAALFIMFDEDSRGKGAPNLYTVWAGPVAKTGFTSSASYNHFSLLSTLEANWNLPHLTSKDQNAPKMGEFFGTSNPGGPTARFTYTPAWPKVNASIAFNASGSSDPDPNSTLQFRWDWTNDGTWDTGWSGAPTAAHAYAAEGKYTSRLEVQNNKGLTNNATHSVVVDSTPPTTTASLSGTSGSNGWYRSSVKATLTATDSLSGVASTFYRLDGGSWKAYTAAVTVTGQGTHTIDYNSTDRAGNAETTHSTPFKIDTIAPSTSATLNGTLNSNGTFYVGPVNVTLSATDATSGVASGTYRVDGGSWRTYMSPFTVAGNGSHTVDYASTDKAGNAETAKSVVIPIGQAAGSPPATTLSLAGTQGSSGWFITSATVTLNATNPAGGAVTIHYRLDGGAWTVYTAPFAISDGIHTLDYNATGSNGMQESTKTTTIRVDTIPPALLNLGPAGVVTTSKVTISWQGLDAGSGLAGFKISIDGAPFQVLGLIFTVTANLSEGGHNIFVTARDVAGNEVTKVVSFRVDTNPFSLTGPYYGLPLIFLIFVPLIAIAMIARRHRRRKRSFQKLRTSYAARREALYNGKR